MTNKRFGRLRADDAPGVARPETNAAHTRSVSPSQNAPARDWTRAKRERSNTSLLMHWMDEKGAVVRLISSSDPTKRESAS